MSDPDRIRAASILIVDDQVLNVELLEQILEGASFTSVTSTTDPHRALELCAAQPPDILLLDIMMPELDGFAVMDALGSAPGAPDVIVLTADVDAKTKRRALAHGASDFLTKPLDPVEVVLRTSNLIARRLVERDLADSNAQLERRVLERTAELERAYERERDDAERLRHLDVMKDAFLVGISHELRTPLTVIGGAARLLADRLGSMTAELIDEVSGMLSANVVRLDDLLLTVLDIDKLTRGTMEARQRPTDIRSLINRVTDDLAVKLTGRDVDVSVDIEEASVDAAYVERILEQLLVNVVRHTPAQGPVSITAREDEMGGLFLEVADSGPGVADDLKLSVFDRFDWGGRQSASSPGLGSGLCLVAGFAKLHGGHAWVEDRPDGGASFRVRLPASVG